MYAIQGIVIVANNDLESVLVHFKASIAKLMR